MLGYLRTIRRRPCGVGFNLPARTERSECALTQEGSLEGLPLSAVRASPGRAATLISPPSFPRFKRSAAAFSAAALLFSGSAILPIGVLILCSSPRLHGVRLFVRTAVILLARTKRSECALTREGSGVSRLRLCAKHRDTGQGSQVDGVEPG